MRLDGPLAQWRTDVLPGACKLAAAEVHLWLLRLDDPRFAFAELVTLLHPEERQRAARFHFERDRRRFAIGRALLRVLIGAYTAVSPADVSLRQRRHGKPFVALAPGAPPFDFNLSHSGASALVAVTGGARVGCDLEVVRDLPEYEEIARHNFAPGETDRLLLLPAAQQVDEFFAIWTHKEAYVKALGGGLSIALDGFEAQPDVGRTRLCSTHSAGQILHGWTLRGFRPQPDTWAAVAVHMAEPVFRFFRYD
jgi:4'-phosphopantetheinyl transferase